MERKMRRNKQTDGERIVKDIKRKTRKQYSAEEKIRIVLDGLRGKESVATLYDYGQVISVVIVVSSIWGIFILS